MRLLFLNVLNVYLREFLHMLVPTFCMCMRDCRFMNMYM